eukprot:3940772-Rhodomonas_salina.3
MKKKEGAGCLRGCYAMPGTHIAHRTMGLCACYAMPGTHIAAMGIRACYGTPGTEVGYGATSRERAASSEAG